MIRTFPPGTLGHYDYVVMLSRYRDKFLLSRHKDRASWELQGGHIEAGETPDAAARRELYEESGAVSADFSPLCDYCGEESGRDNDGAGMVFEVRVRKMDRLPESEMAEAALFNQFPDNLTYPEITRAILKYKETFGEPRFL